MASDEVLNPKAITLPNIPVGSQLSTAPTGAIGISGADLVFFDGTDWQVVTTT